MAKKKGNHNKSTPKNENDQKSTPTRGTWFHTGKTPLKLLPHYLSKKFTEDLLKCYGGSSNVITPLITVINDTEYKASRELSFCATENDYLILKRRHYIPKFYLVYWRHDNTNSRKWKLTGSKPQQNEGPKISDFVSITNAPSQQLGDKISELVVKGFLHVDIELPSIQKMVKTKMCSLYT